jgi:hypothetical protein
MKISSALAAACLLPCLALAANGKDDACRPEGMAVSPVAGVPYCLVYETGGREKLANGV